MLKGRSCFTCGAPCYRYQCKVCRGKNKGGRLSYHYARTLRERETNASEEICKETSSY